MSWIDDNVMVYACIKDFKKFFKSKKYDDGLDYAALIMRGLIDRTIGHYEWLGYHRLIGAAVALDEIIWYDIKEKSGEY